MYLLMSWFAHLQFFIFGFAASAAGQGMLHGFISIEEEEVTDDIDLAPPEQIFLELDSPQEGEDPDPLNQMPSQHALELDDADVGSSPEEDGSRWRPGINVGQYVSRLRG